MKVDIDVVDVDDVVVVDIDIDAVETAVAVSAEKMGDSSSIIAPAALMHSEQQDGFVKEHRGNRNIDSVVVGSLATATRAGAKAVDKLLMAISDDCLRAWCQK